MKLIYMKSIINVEQLLERIANAALHIQNISNIVAVYHSFLVHYQV